MGITFEKKKGGTRGMREEGYHEFCWHVHVSINRLFYNVQPFSAIAIFSFILWMGLLICNYEPFWQEESVWSMILRWLLKLVGRLLRLRRTTVYMFFQMDRDGKFTFMSFEKYIFSRTYGQYVLTKESGRIRRRCWHIKKTEK